MDIKRVGQALKALREERGKTQMTIAAAAGVDKGTVSQIERGERPHTRAETLERMAAGIGVTFPEVLARAGVEPGCLATPAVEIPDRTGLLLSLFLDLPQEEQAAALEDVRQRFAAHVQEGARRAKGGVA